MAMKAAKVGGIRGLLADIGWYSLIPVAQRVMGFVLLPVYTFYLSPAEFGITALVALVVSFTSMLASWGVSYSVQRDYLEYDGRAVGEFLFTAFLISLISASVVYLGVEAVGKLIIPHVLPNWEPRFYFFLRLGLLTQFLLDSTIVVTTWLVVQHRARFYATLQLGVALVDLVMELYLLTQLHMGIRSIYYGQLTAAAVTAVAGVMILLPDLRPRFRWDAVRRIAEYGWQLVPSNVIGYILRRADRFMVQALLPLPRLGVYDFGARAQNAMSMYAESVKKAWRPVYLRQLKHGAPRAELIRFGNVMFEISLVITVGLMMFTREALEVLTAPEYHEAYVVASLLIAQAFFQKIVAFVGGNSLVYEKKIYLNLLATIVTAAVSLSVAALLIPVMGMSGAAVGGLLAFMLFAALSNFWAYRHTMAGCVIDWRRWFGLMALGAIAAAPVFIDLGLGFWLRLLLKSISLAVLVTIVAFLERDWLRRVARNRGSRFHSFFQRLIPKASV